MVTFAASETVGTRSRSTCCFTVCTTILLELDILSSISAALTRDCVAIVGAHVCWVSENNLVGVGVGLRLCVPLRSCFQFSHVRYNVG